MRGYWYMGKFGGPSPKRHVAWSNDEGFVQELLARGAYMSITERNALGATKLVKRGHKNGVPTFTGCKKDSEEQPAPRLQPLQPELQSRDSRIIQVNLELSRSP